MFRPLAPAYRAPHRRGTSIILIALIMLTLFSAVGTAYVFFAMREARLAQARKEEQGAGALPGASAPDPTDTVNAFLGTLIYDTGDANTDLANALRGHSIARSMYGRDLLNLFNTTPWGGVGLFHEDVNNNTGPYAGYNLTGDRAQFVNYRAGAVNGKPFLLDPEYMGLRGFDPMTGQLLPFDPTLHNYVSKAAGYSYPDLKDFFAGAVDPITGAVLVQSFHRDWLFRHPAQKPTDWALDPNNPNWYNAPGGLLTLRPRPFEHPQFPRVSQNADGSYTGDVQNWPGGYTYGLDANGKPVFHSRNDSLWMNLGLPIITLPGNRKVQPLVAPLIVPVDGLFNASAHGNTYGPSYTGYGPWEVNPAYALTTPGEAAAVVNARNFRLLMLQQRNTTTTTRAYNPYTGSPLPSYAPVAWNAAPASLTYPTGNSLTGQPGFAGFQTSNAPESNHPSLFNPTEWPGPATANFRTFPLGDTKRLQRFAFTPDWYSQADVAFAAPTGLYGSPAMYPFTFATGQTTANSYRLDPAHSTRGLFTTRGFDLDRPKLTPTFLSGTLSLGANGKPGAVAAAPYPLPQPVGPGGDFAANNRWVNAMASLGSVNLNRPLADYRSNTAQTLATDVGNAVQADSDRRQLAYDIFARLVVALGAAATVNTTTGQLTIQALPSTPQYDALRYLAQVAVNIVDYIDNDDISTVFEWNPVAPKKPTDPLDPNNFAPTEIGNRVVFGVEKPRLVLNELYSDIVNDKADDVNGATPTSFPIKPAQVRFWAELLNPTMKLNPVNGPLGDGSVPLGAYQIQIRRETRKTGVPVANQDTGGLGTNQYPYLYTTSANPTGSFNTAGALGQPDATVTLGAALLAPNDGQYSQAGVPAKGMLLVGPPVAAKTGSDEFAPPYGMGVWTGAVPSPNLAGAMTSTGMGYTFDLPAQNSTFSDAEFKRHIVLLRRLANPYAGLGATNPYITVDAMDYVPSFDAVHRGKMDATDRKDTGTNPNGYDPVAARFAVGKVQPYAGHAFATVTPGPGKYNAYTFPASMVRNQTTTPMPPNTEKAPLNTFGRHNGSTNAGPPGPTYTAGAIPTLTDTIMTPFDWLVHMDRPLVNQIELLQVRDTAPYRVTDQFVTASGAAPGVTYEAGVANWTSTGTGVARALEYLTVKPFTAGVPHGGRVAGKIAINAVQDRRVLSGLFDPQPGNGFGPTYMDSAWTNWMGTRSVGSGNVTTRTLPNGTTVFPNGTNTDAVAAPGPSIYDTNVTGSNQPFLSLGAPAATAGSTFAYGLGLSDEQTILRRNANPTTPLLYANAGSKPGLVYPVSQPSGPTYTQAEPVRKIFNNTTTVSHTYMVFLTIGYFDVVNANPPPPAGWPSGVAVPPTLGAEAFLAVPGDMRQKFVAMIDMSNMALDPAANTTASVPPFFTSVETTAYAPTPPNVPVTLNIAYSSFNGTNLYVAADGQEIEIKPGDKLILGYGTEQQTVTVRSVGPSAGQVVVIADNGVFRTVWGGTCVSNVRPGYPGPQAGFAYTNPAYRPVLPYIERLR